MYSFYILQIDPELQRLAAISNHLINSLTNLVKSSSTLGRQGAFRCFASLGKYKNIEFVALKASFK